MSFWATFPLNLAANYPNIVLRDQLLQISTTHSSSDQYRISRKTMSASSFCNRPRTSPRVPYDQITTVASSRNKSCHCLPKPRSPPPSKYVSSWGLMLDLRNWLRYFAHPPLILRWQKSKIWPFSIPVSLVSPGFQKWVTRLNYKPNLQQSAFVWPNFTNFCYSSVYPFLKKTAVFKCVKVCWIINNKTCIAWFCWNLLFRSGRLVH